MQAGDSYFSIAGKVYGNQRMFEMLMAANGGKDLHPGDKIRIPQVSNEVAANPYVSQATMDYLSPPAPKTGSIAVLAGDETDGDGKTDPAMYTCHWHFVLVEVQHRHMG